MKRTRKIILVVLTAAFLLGACTDSKTRKEAGENATKQQDSINIGIARMLDSQQIPTFDWSQELQTIYDALTIRATGASSTTMFFIEGVGMVSWCPSSGAPVPATYQSTPSQQYVDLPDDGTREKYPIDLPEPTGAYVGPSNGTWVICLDDAGNKFGQYWEGPVGSTIGVVNGLDPAQRVRIDETTFEFTEQEAEG